jgi:hypothetical protein
LNAHVEDRQSNVEPESQNSDEEENSVDLTSSVPHIGRTCHVEKYLGAAAIFGRLENHGQQPPEENEWWPCKSRTEFQLLSILHRIDGAERHITELLKSEFMSVICYPFKVGRLRISSFVHILIVQRSVPLKI